MSVIRILLADDHALVRSGIRLVLETIAGVQVLGEARDGYNMIEQMQQLHPDVVILDISMPNMNGIEATTRIRKEFPQTRVLILSMHSGEDYVLQALRAGASGYLLKDAEPNELEAALLAIMKGEIYLSPRVSGVVVENYLRSSKYSGPLDILTPRQREILQLIVEGKSTKDISQRLNVSIKTVETHRSLLMERIGIYDIPGLVRFALRTGLIQDDV